MKRTSYARKIDGMGRIIIPPAMREDLNLIIGNTYDFYKHEEDGKVFLCIECRDAETEVEKAKKILAANGIEG